MIRISLKQTCFEEDDLPPRTCLDSVSEMAKEESGEGQGRGIRTGGPTYWFCLSHGISSKSAA